MSEFKIEKTCAFTGHRIITGELDKEHIYKTICQVIEDGYNTFLNGMAMGFDLIAADIVIKAKEKYPHIEIIACVPCPEQDKFFTDADKSEYNRIMNLCGSVKIVSEKYFNGCMQIRDRYMVDNSSLLIAYLRELKGGTYYTVSYAERKNKKILMV